MQVQVLLPVLFTRVSEVFITSEILIFLSFFPIRKDNTMQAYKDLVKALTGLKEDMPREFYMLAELFDYGSFDICRSDDKYIIPYIMNAVSYTHLPHNQLCYSWLFHQAHPQDGMLFHGEYHSPSAG